MSMSNKVPKVVANIAHNRLHITIDGNLSTPSVREVAA